MRDAQDRHRPAAVNWHLAVLPLATAVPLACLMPVVALSIPRYGLTRTLVGTALLIFGSFTVIFLAGSFLFARGLTGR